jgi:hypothetical protein
MSTTDDDDLGAIFGAKRLASQQKRANNRDFSTRLLAERGVFFTTHNAGVHLIVAERWNFWPGTGKFTERKGKPGRPPREGRGVHKLLQLIEEDQLHA